MWRHETAAALIVLLHAHPTSASAASDQLVVDMSSSHAKPPDPIRVDRGERVVLHVRKNMFHACTVTSKIEALPAPADPIAQILGILATIPVPLTASRGPIEYVGPPPGDLAALDRQLKELLQDVVELNADLNDQMTQIQQRATALPEWTACDGTAVCSDTNAARSKLDQLASAIQRTPSRPVASTSVAAARAGELLKLIAARMARAAGEADDGLRSVFAQLRTIQELIDAAVERRQIVVRGREALLTIRDRVLAFTPGVAVEEPLSPQDNAKTIVTVACTNVVTQQPAVYTKTASDSVMNERIPAVTATVLYQKPPRAAVSAGVLYSSVEGREIGIAAHSMGADAVGIATFQKRIVEADRSSWQLLPFSFLNVMVPGLARGRFSFAGSLGVGLNPNNGSTVVEYFAGGSFGIGRALGIQVGAHFGTRQEPAEEFAVGDVVPDRLTVVPTTRVRATALGVALSYGIPLPR